MLPVFLMWSSFLILLISILLFFLRGRKNKNLKIFSGVFLGYMIFRILSYASWMYDFITSTAGMVFSLLFTLFAFTAMVFLWVKHFKKKRFHLTFMAVLLSIYLITEILYHFSALFWVGCWFLRSDWFYNLYFTVQPATSVGILVASCIFPKDELLG